MTALPETAGTRGGVKQGGSLPASLRVMTSSPYDIGSEKVGSEVERDIVRDDPLSLHFSENYRYSAPPLDKMKEMWR